MSRTKVLPLLVLAVADAAAAAPPTPPQSPPPSACSIAPDKAQPVVAPGREIYCAIDVGSRNVKLVVSSMEPGKPLTLRDERSCRSRLNLGTKVYDAAAPAGRQDKPLSAVDVEALANVMNEYQLQCARDKGKLVGADATEWARHAANIGEIRQALLARTSLDLDVLTPELEARYGYLAATRGRAGYLVVDAGSSSFQITSQTPGQEAPRGVSVPLGYEQAARIHFAEAEGYEGGQRAYADDVKRRLTGAGLDLTDLRAAVAGGKLGRRIVALGQDGAIHLAVGGLLRDGTGRWLQDEAAYARALGAVRATFSAEDGEVLRVLKAGEIGAYLRSLSEASQLLQLRADPVRALYGNKALVVPVLFDVLMRELDVDTLVLTPAEMPTGYILAKAGRPR
jgi:Ppx/GppA phosphatase family protein